jgi:hypothetical protein
MKITVKTIEGKSCDLEVEGYYIIESVKEKIEERMDIPVDQQQLIFNGRELQDSHTLNDYNVMRNATLQMEMVGGLLVGGGCDLPKSFVDNTRKDAIRTLDFTSTAPDWRIATNGINIKGIGKNRNCRAYGVMTVHEVGG